MPKFVWEKSGRGQVAKVGLLLISVRPLPKGVGPTRWRVDEIFGAHWLVSGDFAGPLEAEAAAEKAALIAIRSLAKWAALK